jgi:hypothetical protein
VYTRKSLTSILTTNCLSVHIHTQYIHVYAEQEEEENEAAEIESYAGWTDTDALRYRCLTISHIVLCG